MRLGFISSAECYSVRAMQFCCPTPVKPGLTAASRRAAERWRSVLAVGFVESGALFSAFAWQLYDDHGSWDAFNSSGLVLFHVLSLCVTLWRGPHLPDHHEVHQWVAYVWFRVALVAVDVLVLSRLGRQVALDDTAVARWRLVLVVLLTAVSALRLVVLLLAVHALAPEWRDRHSADVSETRPTLGTAPPATRITMARDKGGGALEWL